MNKKKIKIIKEILKKKNLIKTEIKKKIIKSIIQNKKINQIKRLMSQTIIQKKTKKIKNNKICFLTSKKRGIETNLFLSRHSIKKLLNINELQNIKIKSW